MKINNEVKFKYAAILSVLFSIYLATFFYFNSYLPAPFVVNKYDTFMDFYNVFHWSLRDGIYTEWSSVYPPLNFLFANLFQYIFDLQDFSGGSGLLREGIGQQIIYLILIYIVCIIISINISSKEIFNRNEKIYYLVITLLSAPFLFAIERGNLIVLSLPFLCLYIKSNNSIRSSVYYSILVNLKPYFAIIYILNLINRNKNCDQILFLKLAPIFSLLIYIFSGLIINQEYYLTPANLIGFGTQSVLNVVDILALPSSIISFTYIFDVIPSIGRINLLNYIIYAILYSLILLSLVRIFKFGENSDNLSILAVLIITNFSIVTGGYGMLYFIPLVPMLFKEKLNNIITIIIFFLFLGIWDIIIIYYYDIGNTGVYLSGAIVKINQGITLGSIIRPASNFIILFLFYNKLKMNKYE